MADVKTIRHYAQLVAQDCIEDWAREAWYEINDVYGTDFTEDELEQIVSLAGTAKAVLPEGEDDVPA